MRPDDKKTVWNCPICGGDNTVAVKDSEGGVIYEASTHCKDCGRNNYWTHGYFEEHLSEFAEKHLKQCKHGVPTQNICDTCELGLMPMKKPTLEQVAWIFEQINENAGGSFRKLIYDRLGFGPNAYSELYSAGGQNITNAMCAEKHLLESKGDLIDSQIEQIEVLRPIYEAAKILQGAVLNGTHRQKALAIKTLWGATESAARYLEDSDE